MMLGLTGRTPQPAPLPTVVHVAWLSAIGGGELFTLDLVRELARAGFEQRLFYLGPGGELAPALAELGVPTRGFPKRTRAGPATLARLAYALRRQRTDVVQVHGEAGILWGIAAARLAGAPAVAALLYQLGVGGRGKRLALRLLLRRADLVQCGSEAVRRFAISGLGVAPERAVVAHCGIRVARFRGVAEARRGGRFDPGDEPLVVAIGRLVMVKGHAVLLAACRRLLERGVPVRLEIAGDGPERERLAGEIARLGLDGRARLVGTVWPPNPLLARATLFVAPSLEEAQGLAPLEAFAAEVPVVATCVGGLAEMVSDGETGLLVPPGDAAALADAIQRMVENTELRKALVRRAARGVEEFDMPRIAQQFAAHYRALAGGVGRIRR